MLLDSGPARLANDRPGRFEDAAMRVVKIREGGVVRQVRLLDDAGRPVEVACQFLEHLVDRGFSPNTLCAYGYDLQHLFGFLEQERMVWQAFGPADTLRFLGYLRRLPSKRAAQRLGLTVVVGGAAAPGMLLSPSTVNRMLAGVSSFFDWAIAAQEYTRGESPFQVCDDQALARVPERH